MYIKRKKINRNIIIIFTIFVSIFFVFLNSNKKLVRKEFFYVVDLIDSNLHKTTTFAELFGYNNIYSMGETYLDFFKTVLVNFPSFLNKIPSYYKSSQYQFEVIDLNYNFNNYKKLLEDRLRSIKYNVGLEDRQQVNGSLIDNKKIYKIETSLKGKLIDHFRTPNRFSLKLTTKNNEFFYGMREFSIQKPESRASPYEQIFLEIAKNLGFIIPKHIFANVNFNGKSWGIMNIEENPTKETLELQQSSGELVFQFGNEKNKFLEKNFFSTPPMDSIINLETFPIRFLDEKRVHDNKFFIRNLSQEKFDQNIYDYLDHEKMCTLAILSIIWGSSHVLELNNTQYEFNIYSRKISPIPQDVASSPIKIKDLKDITPITRLYFNSCSKVENKRKLLSQIRLAVQNSEKKIDLLELQFPMNTKFKTQTIFENISFIEKNINNFLKIIKNKFPIKKEIYNKEILERIDIFNIHFFRKNNLFSLHLGNQLKSNIKIRNIVLRNKKNNNLINKKIKVNKVVSGIYFDNYNEYIENKNKTKLIIPIDASMMNTLIDEIYFDLEIDKVNLKLVVSNDFLKFNYDKPRLEDSKFEFIEKNNKGFYKWKNGNWTVSSPIILNNDLIIEKGTKINFINQSYLYVQGKIKILGEKFNKVFLYSNDKSWKGVHINSNDKQSASILQNVIISDLNSYADDKFKMNGGINFYNSDVKINDIFIYNVYSEDAINLIDSTFEISNLHIENAGSDALDSDFSTGVVKNSLFKNITGDAIDTSGSHVTVQDSAFDKVLDKAISAGEKSNLNLSNLSFKSCLICIVSKDDSIVKINDFNLQNYSLYFAAAYKKKNFYKNGGEIYFNNSSKSKLKSLRIVKDKNSRIFLKNNELETEINENFKYFYDYGVFN